MAALSGIEITGIDDVIKILEQVTPRHANNLMRNTVRGIAAEARKEIRSRAPKGNRGRLSGAKEVKIRMRRAIRGAQIAEVVFSNRAFFWRFVEHGTGGNNPQPAQPFVIPSRNLVVARMNRLIIESFSKTLEKTIKRELKKQAKLNR